MLFDRKTELQSFEIKVYNVFMTTGELELLKTVLDIPESSNIEYLSISTSDGHGGQFKVHLLD